MMNYIWMGIIFVSFISAAITGRMGEMTQAMMESAKAAVELAIGLVGIMAFWLGVMKVAQDAGLLKKIARAIRPVMIRLFPDVPEDHPAMSAMIMNISANMLGLANAATPFGIKAIMELNKLNKKKGVATNAMCLFLAINTSNVTLLPMGAIAIRASMGSEQAAAIVGTTLFATCCSTIVAIVVATALSKLPAYDLKNYTGDDEPENDGGGEKQLEAPNEKEDEK